MKEVKTVLDVPAIADLCERTANDEEWQEWYGCAIRSEHSALFDDEASSHAAYQQTIKSYNDEKGWHDPTQTTL